MIPQNIIQAFEQGVNEKLEKIDGSEKLLVNINDFTSTLHTATDFYYKEIKMEEIEMARRDEEDAKMPMEHHLTNLHKIILTDHPKLKLWQRRSSFLRTMNDFKLWVQNRIYLASDVQSVRWGIMAGNLTKIQSLFGMSHSSHTVSRIEIGIMNQLNMFIIESGQSMYETFKLGR